MTHGHGGGPRFNLSDWTLHHRTLVGYFLLVIALLGVFAWGKLSQAEDPPFTFKLMVVRTFWPGASAEDVERQVTDRIEKKLQETPYLDRISSYSRAGESTVMFFAKDSTPPAQVPDVYYQVRRSATCAIPCRPASRGRSSTTSSATFSAISTR